MAIEILLPKLGFSMNEGTSPNGWSPTARSRDEGEPLYALESEKSVQEIEAPASGKLKIVAGRRGLRGRHRARRDRVTRARIHERHAADLLLATCRLGRRWISPQFGEVEVVPLSRIQKLAAGSCRATGSQIPQVTHHDDADITALEALPRDAWRSRPAARVTPVPFLVKALVEGLRAFPRFNASLDASGQNAGAEEILPHRRRRGHARRPAGAGDPRLRQEGRRASSPPKSPTSLARARTKGLPMADMVGGCLTDQLARPHRRHGVHADHQRARSGHPRRDEGALEAPARRTMAIGWRLMLPLSLSYDHRVINGADAARFLVHVAAALSKPESLVDQIDAQRG